MAVHAGSSGPANTDTLADLDSFGSGPHLDHPTNDLMAQHCGVLREPPFIIEHREIRVTNTAGIDSHLNFFDPKRSKINLLLDKVALGTGRHPCIDCRHSLN